MTDNAILGMKNVVKEYRRKTRSDRSGTVFRALDDVSLEVGESETLSVVGESGSGKSTTARVLARLIDPNSGRVLLEGDDITKSQGRGLHRLRRTVQFVFQDPYSSLNPRHEVKDIIVAPLRYQGIKLQRPAREIAADLMDRVGLNPDHATRLPHQFSGGQAQRIGIARALSIEPKVVICDEAVSALDVSVQAQIIKLLMDLKNDLQLSYLFIAHDLAVVREISDRVAVMRGGAIVEEGTRDAVFGDPQNPYTRELMAAAPRLKYSWTDAKEQG